MTKKAQIKLFETIAVLIVFLILVGFGLIIYNSIQKNNFEKDKVRITDTTALVITQKAIALPELSCISPGSPQHHCVDSFKLKALASVSTASETAEAEYFNTLRTSSITIQQVWPTKKDPIVVYNKTPTTTRRKNVFTTPVLINNPVTEQNSFGKLEVITYGQ